MNKFEYDHILFIGFGGPDKPEDIRPFIAEVTKGIPIPKERLEDVAHHYEVIGGFSPYNKYTADLVDKVKSALSQQGIELPIYIGMKNWHPFLKDSLAEIKSRKLKRGIAIILAAQRSDASYQKYIRALDEAKQSLGFNCDYDFLPHWYQNNGFIRAQAQQLKEIAGHLLREQNDTKFIFCAHSIPVDMANQSNYVDEIKTGAYKVAESLGVKDWQVAYQSRSGSPRQPWLEPDVLSVIEECAKINVKNIVLIPIGFLCDNAEVLYDLDIEAKQKTESLGLKYFRASTVMDHPDFVQMFAQLIYDQYTKSNQGDTMSGIQKAPYVKDEQPGKKAYCACGESANQPYCDGAHSRKMTGKVPTIVEIDAAKKVAWCGCRQSKNGAFCDGSHKSI